ncbi:MAG TPA: hypothetical protein VGF07_01975 [Stellaceae bacterium]|jgi:hypothetical protein
MSEQRSGQADDLRSAIAGALADDKGRAIPPAVREERGAGDGAAAAARQQTEEGASGAPSGGRSAPDAEDTRGAGALDEGGRPAAADAEGGPSDQAPGGERQRGSAEAPTHWSAGDKAVFNALPETAKTPFLDLYKRMEAGFTPKLQRGAQLERDYGALDQNLFTPQIREVLRGKGIAEPRQMIEAWAQVEIGLVNPDTRNQVLARLIHAYQADPGEVARILGELRGFAPTTGHDGAAPGAGAGGIGAGNGAAAAPGGAPAVFSGAGAVDPRLDARLRALETETSAQKAAREAAEYTRAGREIETFANEKDAQGNLKHPFFAELEADMTVLAQSERIQGKAPVLAELYDRALWANPSTRDKHLALQRDAEAKRAAEDRRAKAEQARRAAVSVTGAPGPGQAQIGAPDRSLRDEIRANMAGGPATSGGAGRI